MISHNFGFVPNGHHRGSGKQRNKTVPDGSGNMTFSTSLEFLYNQKVALEERQKNNKENKSMLLGVLNSESGLDTLKKRFNAFGIFGKKAQNDPSKIDETEFEQVFLWGQNMTKVQLRNIDKSMSALCRHLGDPKATQHNYEKSTKFKEAFDLAKTTFMLVVAAYDESFFSVNEDDPKKATLSMGYVKIGTGRKPIISSFERPMQEGLVEVEWNGGKYMDYLLDPDGSISVMTTRSYLANYEGTNAANLKWIETKNSDDGGFWAVQIAGLRPDDIPVELVASFPEETIAEFKDAYQIQFSYVMGRSDEKTLSDVLKLSNKEDGARDAVMVFTGKIDIDRMRINEYEPDNGDKRKYVTFDLKQGTFYNQKFID